MIWGATQAKSKFSEVLDKAEEQGPQRIQRRKRSFLLLTEEQYFLQQKPAAAQATTANTWEAMRPSFSERYDMDLPRVHGSLRPVDLG